MTSLTALPSPAAIQRVEWLVSLRGGGDLPAMVERQKAAPKKVSMVSP